MSIRRVPGTDFDYFLVLFDERGKERPGPDGTMLTDTVTNLVVAGGVTDVFFTSHGWKGDIPAAIDQYDRWVGTVLAMQSDRDAARRQRARFMPLVVCLHWPSLPWGDETIRANIVATLSGAPEVSIEEVVDTYATRIVDTPYSRAAIRTILEAARYYPDATNLPRALCDAYLTLFAESGLGCGDASGRPGADQDGFDPQAIIDDARSAASTDSVAGVLGLGNALWDGILAPLRQLSFWKMKDRARQFGESAGHELLIRLQKAAPGAHFHLMGHSFGCIVVSAAVAGPRVGERLPRAVHSLFLVQGALSHWSYVADIPFSPGTPGYFHRILRDGLVQGPLVTTRSMHDTAIGRFYPLGALLKKQFLLDSDYPVYGGIGAFGIQGIVGAEDMPMQPATFIYRFHGGRVYNLEASNIIRNGSGASGAHSDIAHPEVAHAFWSAVLAPVHTTQQAVPVPFYPPKASLDIHSTGGGLLGADPAPATRSAYATGAEPPLPQGPFEAREQRWINAAIEDHARDAPLVASRWYTLAFDVDVTRRVDAIVTAPFAAPQVEKQLFPQGIDEVVLTVQLDSDDFDLSTSTSKLRLPRSGRSNTKARFDLSPRHGGACSVKATVHKEGNFIQQMELTFLVGVDWPMPVRVTATGRPPSAAALVHPRDVALSMSPTIGGYDFVMWRPVSSRARLPLQPAFLASAVETARRELTKVVMQRDAAGNHVFQTGIEIPKAEQDIALKTMARAGSLLFQKMFFGPAAGADSKACGEFLRKMASDRTKRLKLQIVAESTPVPWGLLYVGDASAGATMDWDNFIGMRHLIEQIPLQNTFTTSECEIPSDRPQLAISVNVNSGIDAQMGINLVAQQQLFWESAAAARKHMRVIQRTTSAQVVQALADVATDDQILYFYCHAESTGLTDPGGPDASCLVLSDAPITLSDLNLDAPTTIQLRGNPLVFINACESAEMSPAFYDGFVPYFMAKGARGVIGTECKTPALFAVEWAKRFFMRFLDGEPLSETFLALRREFLEEHRNPLGLLYAIHCDGDTRIQPALAAV
jgi:hypothetical protein